jgi:hypothetical protein
MKNILGKISAAKTVPREFDRRIWWSTKCYIFQMQHSDIKVEQKSYVWIQVDDSTMQTSWRRIALLGCYMAAPLSHPQERGPEKIKSHS